MSPFKANYNKVYDLTYYRGGGVGPPQKAVFIVEGGGKLGYYKWRIG